MSASIRGHVFEDVILFGPLLEVGIEHGLKSLIASILALMDSLNHDEPVAGRERQRPEDNAINDAKDGGVGADAEREREDSHGGEARVLQQLAEGEFEIVHNSLNRESLNR